MKGVFKKKTPNMIDSYGEAFQQRFVTEIYLNRKIEEIDETVLTDF